MKMGKVGILDYGIGNVKSISNALHCIGFEPVLTSQETEIMAADAVILPGVGAFAKGMENLQAYKLKPIIEQYVNTGKPFIGICLGMQMLFEESEEFGLSQGLGLIKGKVVRIPVKPERNDKLPHIQWNDINTPSGVHASQIWQGLPKQMKVYFVHSYVAMPAHANDILFETMYGDLKLCAGVRHNNVIGVQFHPEKSGKNGLQLLKNLVSTRPTNNQ